MTDQELTALAVKIDRWVQSQALLDDRVIAGEFVQRRYRSPDVALFVFNALITRWPQVNSVALYRFGDTYIISQPPLANAERGYGFLELATNSLPYEMTVQAVHYPWVLDAIAGVDAMADMLGVSKVGAMGIWNWYYDAYLKGGVKDRA